MLRSKGVDGILDRHFNPYLEDIQVTCNLMLRGDKARCMIIYTVLCPHIKECIVFAHPYSYSLIHNS